MEHNTDEKTIISQLFVSKEKVTERLSSLVILSKGIVNIIEETGETYLEDSSYFNNNDKIFLFVLGNYFSYKSKLKESPNITLSELAEKLGVPRTTIPAPMNKLLGEKVILKSEKGSYHLNIDNYKKVKEILLKIKEKNEKS